MGLRPILLLFYEIIKFVNVNSSNRIYLLMNDKFPIGCLTHMQNKYQSLFEVAVGGLFAVAVGVNAGIVEASIFDVQLSSTVFEAIGVALDWATLISITALVVAYLTTLPTISRMTDGKRVLILLTILLLVLGMIQPEYASENNVIGLFAVGISAGGFWALNTPTQ